MDEKTDRLYPSAPLENIDLEQQLEKKLNDVKSFNNHINNIKEKITYFKDKNKKSKKKFKKYTTISRILKSFDTLGIFATKSSSINLSLTGIGSIAIPLSTALACVSSIGNKLLYDIIIKQYNKYKKENEKNQQTIKHFDKLYRESLQDIVIDKTEYESLCIIFTEYVDENENESFFITINKRN